MGTKQTEWLSPAEAGRVLGVTPQRIRQLATAGRLPYQRTPLGRLIDAGAVEALRLERAQQKGSAA